MSDIEREAFEQWYSQEFDVTKAWILDRRDGQHGYSDRDLFHAYRGYMHAARQAPASGEVEPLEWSPIMEPVEGCRYNHVYSETLFGRFLITWKGWKDGGDPFCIDETPWGSFDEAFPALDLAKEHCEREFLKRLLSYTHPPAKVPEELVRQCEQAIDEAAQRKGGTLNGVREAQKKIRELLTTPTPATTAGADGLPDEVIKAAVDRFLQWKLPADFYPDGGVSFDRAYEYDSPHWPVGTNILTYEQAERMLRECLGATTPQPPVEQEGKGDE